MRCKNCGSENDNNLYICQNCGSPLYDEEAPVDDGLGTTQVFGTLDNPNNTKNPIDAAAERAAAREAAEEERKRKQQVTTIVVLALVLVLILAGTLFAVVHAKNKENEASTSEISTSETSSQETTKENTTERTTEPTTESTTAETTTEASYTVSVSSNEGGSVDGGGSFSLGDNVTVTATADSGYEFDGWYQGSTKKSSNAVYTFTVTENTDLKAVFKIVQAEPDETNIDTDTDEEPLG